MIAAPLFVAAAVLALLELDAASACQVMLCRPAVFGPALGAAFGQAELGTGLGALWELVTLDEAPIGGHLSINATAAAGGCLLLCLGGGGVAPEAALACGMLVGWAHQRLELGLRRRRASCGARCDDTLATGRKPRLGWVALRELGLQAAMTFLVLSALLCARPWLAARWPAAPDALRAALRMGLAACPWIGCVGLARALKVVA